MSNYFLALALIPVVLQVIIMIIVVLFSFLSLFSLHAHGQEDDNVIDFDRLLTQIVIERFEKTLGIGIIKDQVSLSI